MALADFNFYKIINKTEFEAESLKSREVTVILEGLGQKAVLVTRVMLFSLIYDGVILPVNLDGAANPFEFGGYAAYIDDADDVWLGVPA
jgi:hypothetical protein